MRSDVGVDGAGVNIPVDLVGPVDVLFDDNRVWSFNPARDSDVRRGRRIVPWPKALKTFLDGSTRAVVRAHGTGETYFDGEVQLGTGDARISVTDRNDNPLAVDKGGRLQRTFSKTDDTMRELIMDAVEQVLDDLRTVCGLEAYLCYGCLLGAVRDGHMIGHDSDADLSYYSHHTHPYDIIRENRAAELKMRERGWTIIRMSAADFKVWVKLPDGRRCGIDVFTSFHIDGYFHLMATKRGPLDRSAVLPLSTVTLEGREILAPADPEAYLAWTYGPDWRIPDPSFNFDHPRSSVRRMSAWWRGSRNHLKYWTDFYKSGRSSRVPSAPSKFARWVGERIESGDQILDVGAGTGRDAIWFAKRGHQVTAFDFSPASRFVLARQARRKRVTVARRHLNLNDLKSTLIVGARLAQRREPRHVYARFLLDSVEKPARHEFFRFASMVQRSGGLTFLEFRTPASAHERTTFGHHFRQFLDPSLVVSEIEERGGTVVHQEVGRDLAPLAKENPQVCRIIVRWKQ